MDDPSECEDEHERKKAEGRHMGIFCHAIEM